MEDDELVGDLVREGLEVHGYRVVLARSPEEALGLLDEGAEDAALLLTDLVMPGISGVALAERVRSSRPGVRVLFMSGYSETVATKAGLAPSAASSSPSP